MIIGLYKFCRKRFSKVNFTIYWCGGHLGHVTCTIYKYFLSAIPRRLHIKFALIGKAVLEKKIFENGGHIHAYIAPGQGRQPPGIIFCINTIIQSIESFAASFPPINDSFPHSNV